MYERDTARAVSPVIGVILMVAITVLLAATAATFFTGFEDSLSGAGAPTVAVGYEFDVDSSGHELSIKFQSGDVVTSDNVVAHVSNADCRGTRTVTDRFDVSELGVTGSTISAGTRGRVAVDTVCPPGTSQLDLSGTEVRLSWLEPGTQNGNTLFRWRGPGA